ncbi:MAG: MerR family transcriptional regulator [Nitrospirota bacterium]|nr:MerR family transcriptional regulator [Nitrospirota bacterium]
MEKHNYTIDDISSLSGYPRRTIRYYVEIGLIEPPAGRGRGGFYNDSHLSKLHRIRAHQDKGIGLASITSMLKAEGIGMEESNRDIWVRFDIAPGIEISVRKDREERDRKRINEIVRMAKAIAEQEGSERE